MNFGEFMKEIGLQWEDTADFKQRYHQFQLPIVLPF